MKNYEDELEAEDIVETKDIVETEKIIKQEKVQYVNDTTDETDKKSKKKKRKKEDKEDESENSVLKEVLSWVKIFVGAFLFAYIVTTFVIINATIPTGSMKNTINEGDKVIGLRLAYLFDEPERGEIVMFWAPDKKDTIYIKRVIGTPGDTVKIENNTVYVNGKALKEPYISEWTNSPGTSEWVLGKDEYFMMGDNRNHSNDSRYFDKPIKEKAIIAKALFRWSPSLKILK